MNKGERGKRRVRDEYGGSGNERGSKRRREEITLKPLISRGQTPSLCQGVTQSEGQGLAVPLQAAAELEV